MENRVHPHHQRSSSRRRLIFLAALALACLPRLAREAHAHDPAALSVPAGLEVPAGNRLFLLGHAAGTQNYVCLPSATAPSGFAWTFFAPQATLFGPFGPQMITHFLSPNPDEAGTPRATWQSSRDSSAAWAVVFKSSADPEFVEPGAVPWLLLDVVGTRPGPTGGRALAATTYVQRVHTSGGVAPASGCGAATDVGAKTLVPYVADYYFYRHGLR